ncbi:MAG: hypothetical protein JJU37_05675 [Balneolaceae bacterium]|nr:hypothetical protein [Balneolaceae bacterium]
MSQYRKIENIKARIIETERLLEMVENHPIMAESLKYKLFELKRELKSFDAESFESKISLLFSGKAIIGSLGIKSSFVSKTIKPFQEMVKTEAALIRFGRVGKRGRAKSGINTNLYLTALPTGSFGIELTQIESEDLFDAQDMTQAMKNVALLINRTSENDETFEEAIENTPKRNLQHLKSFLQEVYEENSMLKMECHDLGIVINEGKVAEAYQRVSKTTDDSEEVFVNGILRGILLDSAKFEIQTISGEKISGFINPDLDEEVLIEFDRLFLNQECKIHLQKHLTEFVTGRSKIDYELQDILHPD